MYKYELQDMNLSAHHVIFKKDGKARHFSICHPYIFLTDFCDVYILEKETLQVIDMFRLGVDVSSDIGAVRFDATHAYIAMRNGQVAVMEMKSRAYKKYDLCGVSYWDHCVSDGRLYAGTVQGNLLEMDTGRMIVKRQLSLGKKNIYSVFIYENHIFTVSQDMTIKATRIDSFEVACVAKKAVRGMAKIIGIHKGRLVVADTHKISLWDCQTLQYVDAFDFPTGQFNKGVVLQGNVLYGSDFQRVYSAELD
jgi:hypothetical protein